MKSCNAPWLILGISAFTDFTLTFATALLATAGPWDHRTIIAGALGGLVVGLRTVQQYVRHLMPDTAESDSPVPAATILRGQ